VTGVERQDFDCTKTVGFFPTRLLRVDFTVDDQKAIAKIDVPEPACVGTP